MARKKAEPEKKQKLRIKLSGYDHKVVDSSVRQIVKVVQRYGAKIRGPIPLPTQIHKYTVKRSVFVNEDAREQFETRIHKRLIDILEPKAEIINALRDLNLPAGVDIKVKTG